MLLQTNKFHLIRVGFNTFSKSFLGVSPTSLHINAYLKCAYVGMSQQSCLKFGLFWMYRFRIVSNGTTLVFPLFTKIPRPIQFLKPGELFSLRWYSAELQLRSTRSNPLHSHCMRLIESVPVKIFVITASHFVQHRFRRHIFECNYIYIYIYIYICDMCVCVCVSF
jgi:hypothetical protein